MRKPPHTRAQCFQCLYTRNKGLYRTEGTDFSSGSSLEEASQPDVKRWSLAPTACRRARRIPASMF